MEFMSALDVTFLVSVGYIRYYQGRSNGELEKVHPFVPMLPENLKLCANSSCQVAKFGKNDL